MKNGKLKVESGIPLPPKKGKGELVNLMESMKVGDSFLYPIAKRNGLMAYASRAKIKITTRAEDEGHVRVWRTE